jgi:two-component system, LuxR family, response regulator FixJ
MLNPVEDSVQFCKPIISLQPDSRLSRDFDMASFIRQPEIHIVDDDEAVRDSLDVYLTLKDLKVAVFASAQDFLDHGPALLDLLILDVNMPQIDGFALLEILKEKECTCPVILMSGLGDPNLKARAERAGVAAFIDKPIDTPFLYATITTLLSADLN